MPQWCGITKSIGTSRLPRYNERLYSVEQSIDKLSLYAISDVYWCYIYESGTPDLGAQQQAFKSKLNLMALPMDCHI